MKKRLPQSHTTHRVVFFSLVILVLLAPLAWPLAAQTIAERKWEIEVHGGGMLVNNPTDGTAALPPAGSPFTLTRPPASSRHVSSWYFGDGTVLVNEVGTALTAQFGGVAGNITALDPVLNRSVVQRQHGGSFGFRISRHINPRYTAEFGFDYTRGPLEMSGTGLGGIEASRASFISAFNSRFFPGLLRTVTSEATIHNSEGHQTFTTGVLSINLKTDGKIVPYASVGGGILVNSGDAPSATLAGNYQLQLLPGTPFGPAGLVTHNETDTVDLRYSIERRAFVGVLGGGVKYSVSPRWGVRLDVRAHLSKNSIGNLVDAKPTVATITTPRLVNTSPTTPTLVLSTSPGAPSSLSGPPIDGAETFRGSGIQSQVNVTTGVFWRF